MSHTSPGDLETRDPQQAKEQLDLERDFIAAVLDTAGALVVVLDRQGRIVRFNQAGERTTGYTSEEVEGKHPWDLFLASQDVERVKSVFQDLKAGQFPNTYENDWLTKDGRSRRIAWSNTAIQDEAGHVQFVVATGIDITERQEAERQLRQARDELEDRVARRTSELRWRASFENLITTISTHFIELSSGEIDAGINQALEDVGQFMGVDRSYVFCFSDDGATMTNTHEWCAEGIAPQSQRLSDVPTEALSWSNKILVRGQVLHIPRVADLPPQATAERREFQTQGTQSLIAVPMIYQGETMGFVGFDAVTTEKVWSQEAIRLLRILSAVFVNALERRRTDEALRESQRMLSTLISNLPGMAYRCLNDPGWKMTFVSQGSRELTGYSPEALIDNREVAYGELIHPDDRESVWEEVQAALEARRPFELTYRLLTPMGEKWVWEHGEGVDIPDEDGLVVEGFVTEITERVLAQQNLEQRVAERTHELSTLLEISHNVASTLELEPLLGQVLEQLKSVVTYDAASTMILDQGELKVLAYRGPIPQEEALQLRFSLEEAAANRAVIDRREPVIIDNVLGDDPLAEGVRRAAGPELETTYRYLRCWMGVPLIVKDRVLGMLTLDHSEPGCYSAHQAELVMAFANQVAVTIDNARLYAQVKRHADEVETLFSIQQAITSRLDPDTVLQLIADAARRLTETDMSGVYLLKDDDLEIAIVSGRISPEAVGYRVPVEASVAGLSVENGQPFVVSDSASDPRVHHAVADKVGAKSFLTVPLLSEDRPIGTIIVANKRPGDFDAVDERRLTMLASSAVIGLENARLYQSEQARRHEADRRRQVAEGLRDILRTLNSNLPVDRVLDSIVDQSLQLLHADGCAIYRWEPGRDVIEVVTTEGMPEAFRAVDAFPRVETAANQAIMDAEPFAVPDFGQYPADVDEAVGSIRALSATVRANFRSSLSVPLVVAEMVYGAITLYYRTPRSFAKEDIELAESYANQAALAIENAQLRERVEQTAVAAERNRLARDLHDAVTQTLFSASLIAEVLPRIWAQDREEGRRRLQELRELTRGALAEMRTLLLELRPSALEDTALGDLLRQLGESITGRARVPVSVAVEGACELGSEVKVALYRIAQEALNNVAKHADATEARVLLDCQPGQVRLRVCDDGRGFDPQTLPAESLGVGIMRERAEVIGADLRIESEIGQGTDIVVRWAE